MAKSMRIEKGFVQRVGETGVEVGCLPRWARKALYSGAPEKMTGTLTFTPDANPEGDAVEALCEHKKDGVCRSQPVLEDCPGEERCVSWLQREFAAARTVRAEEQGLRARLIAVHREAVGYRNRALKAEAQVAEERKGERVVTAATPLEMPLDLSGGPLGFFIQVDGPGPYAIRRKDPEPEKVVRPWVIDEHLWICPNCPGKRGKNNVVNAGVGCCPSCYREFGEPCDLPEGER